MYHASYAFLAICGDGCDETLDWWFSVEVKELAEKSLERDAPPQPALYP